MKAIKKIVAIIAVTALSMSICAFSASAEEISQEQILENQSSCLESYENLLDSFSTDNQIDYPDDFGGIYFEQETGTTTICLTDTKNAELYESYFDDELIQYEIVKYSYDELTELYNFISDNMIEYNVFETSVSEKTNCVNVGLKSEDDKEILIDFLEEHDYDSEMIEFNTEYIPVTAEVNTDTMINLPQPVFASSTVNYAYAGSEIQVHIPNANYYYSGTIGANAYNVNTNQYGVITAAHVIASNTSGIRNNEGVMMNNASGIVSQFGGTLDAAFVPFNSSNSFMCSSAIRNGNEVSQIYKRQYLTSPTMVGCQIVKYGISTGKQYGTITNLISSVTYGDTTINDVIQYEMSRAGGDSGAPVGLVSSDGVYLLGIHSGGSGNRCYAIKCVNIENGLNIEFVTVQ